MLYSSRVLIKSYQKEILILLLLAAASLPTIRWMAERWFAPDSYYSHGILVPFVSLFLVIKKWNLLKELPYEPSVWGMRLFIIGIIFYWASALLHVYSSSGFAMLVITIGLVLHFFGKKVLQETLFPILFLVFMVPLPLIVVAFICFKLKVVAAQLATLILNVIGLPAIQESSLIKMRHCYVLVEDTCGGLRSLISLAALGCLFAYQLKSTFPKKALLFLSAIPIATFANACRIVFLSAVAELWGTEHTQGFLHSLSGYLVFALAFFFLFFIKRLLEKSSTA